MKQWMTLLGLALTLLLGACTTLSVTDDSPLVFAAEGRLSLVTRLSAAEPKQMSARFVWAETDRLTQVDLLSPFGEILARLRVGAHSSELQSKQGIETAANPEQLVEKYFGAPLPVTGLRYWMRGQDKAGRQHAPQSFEEDGWRMEYTQMSLENSAWPRIIFLQRQLPQGASVEVRLVIDQWKP
jgi:outer membrane lipoprotein LolB